LSQVFKGRLTNQKEDKAAAQSRAEINGVFRLLAASNIDIFPMELH